MAAASLHGILVVRTGLVVGGRGEEERLAVQNGQVLGVQSENVLVQQGLLALAHRALEGTGEVGIGAVLAEPFRRLDSGIIATDAARAAVLFFRHRTCKGEQCAPGSECPCWLTTTTSGNRQFATRSDALF